MKRNRFVTIGMIVFAGLVFAACPYSSSVPLSKATVKYDSKLLGTWEEDDYLSDEPPYVVISDIDGKRFEVEKFEYSTYDEEYTSEVYECYFTAIGDTKFLNVAQGDSLYYFYKIEMLGEDQLKLFEVTDNIDEEFTSSKEILAFFTKNKDLSFFYNTDELTYNKSEE